MRRALRLPQRLAMLALPALLGGCDMVVMNPTGDIAVQQRDLILFSTGVMLLIIVPVMVLTVVFATRGAMSSNRDIVSVLHYVGAEAGFIAREFQRHFLLLGLKGGLWGAAAACILFALLSFFIGRSIATPEGDQVSALFGRFAIGPAGYIGALGIAVLIAIMTAVTSRLTVYRHLASIE